MICVYGPDCTDFTTNGYGTLNPLSATVTETLNGEYELELEHPIDDQGKWQRLAEGYIIKAPVPAGYTPAIATQQKSGQIAAEIWAVSSNILYIRSGPDLSYKVIGSYPHDTEVIVINKDDDTWNEVTTPDGKHGWMYRPYMRFVRTVETGHIEEAEEEIKEPMVLREQPFRIYRVVPELDKVTVYARHVFYDLLDNMIQTYSPPASATGAQAVQGLSQACLSAHDFKFYSDLTSTAEEVTFANVNPVEALMGDEGLLAKYGGELARDWWDVYIVERVGVDSGVQVRQAKNLLGITYDVDLTDVVTRIMPTGTDADGEPLYLPEVYVDSPIIGRYPHPKWAHIDVGEAKETKSGSDRKTKEQCYQLMREAVQAQYDAGCDLPNVTLDVDFINCPDTEEYKEYSFLQGIYLGDTVRVIAPRVGVNVAMRMTQYTYDCLTKKYTQMTLGSVAETVEGSVISARQLPNGIISGSKLALNSVGSGALQGGAVSSAHIQLAAIETAHIQDAAIQSAKIADAAIVTAKIDDAAITTAKIEDAAVTRAKIGEAAIGTAQIDDAAITRAKIGEAAIGSAQIDTGVINSAHIGQGQIQEAHIHDAAITTAKIDDAAITRAKIGNAAIGTAQIEDAAITNAKIGGAAIDTANIKDAAITTAKIVDGQITSAKIADLAVTTGKIDDLAVSTAKIAVGAITTAKIGDLAVDTAKIALGAITAALIQNGAVGTAQIADASITDAKIVSLNADVITSGTLATERLIITGADGLIYEINAEASGLSMQELSKEKYREQLSGNVLVARSVTAEQIAAATITANEILSGTITGDKIAAATIDTGNIKAGAITTSLISSDFGATLDLSSNEGINQTVEKVYVDMNNISVGGRNLMLNTAVNFPSKYTDVTLTAQERGVTVEDWACDDAMRMAGYVRSTLVCMLFSPGSHGLSTKGENWNRLRPGQEYTYSLYLKNNHATNAVCVRMNGIGKGYVAIEPGQAVRWVDTGAWTNPQDGANPPFIQINVATATAGDEFDVTFWHPKIEYGNKVTDWTPAPEDAAADLKALSDNVEVLVGYRVEIVSTSDILSDDIPQTTLRARVWHGSQDVTDSIPASRFRWTRVTSDSTADTLWNNNHKGVKSITLGKADVLYSATYNCELEEAT